ncbi:MAG: SO_0444 family Cu/Zn efflux transporter [Planctomycetota bacterium]|jgi:uncharacterized membrane protein YraQ (UPF0718 family)
MQYLWQILIEFWATVAAMSPYLLFGFFMAGVLSVLVSQQFVERHLGGRGPWPLIKASLFGVPLPLCSCGVLPVSMSLHKHGASKGSTVSFLLSTPQTGMDSIFVTLSLLGPVFAVFRPLTAFITGIFGGSLVDMFTPKEEHQQEKEPCSDECCDPDQKTSKIKRGLKYAFITLPRDIGKAMLIGLIIAAIITAFVPDDFFANRLPATGILAMLVMVVLGVPVYVCATASVPVAAALIAKGLAPGVALVFLITGPATNAASFITILKVLGARTAVIYMLSVIVCAIAAGLTLDAMYPGLSVSVQSHVHQMSPSIIGHLSAAVLLTVLAFAIFYKPKNAH